jgi:hypothetical protein
MAHVTHPSYIQKCALFFQSKMCKKPVNRSLINSSRANEDPLPLKP